jgi:CubicO group peptidase (beta-lactamase class C family)/pimeloyl-ACP methyl ester carboxylesterase
MRIVSRTLMLSLLAWATATAVTTAEARQAPTPAPGPGPAPLTQAIATLVQPDEPGIAVCVAENGVVTALVARGFANLERREPMTTATPTYVASIAKGFTTVAILQLVEQGKLRLDDTLGAIMPPPALPAFTAPITIAQLLSHTSGMPDYPDDLPGDPLVTNATVLKWLNAQTALASRPGSEWNYSNAGFVVLAAVFEKVSGRALAEYFQTEFFTPLHMSSTFVFSAATKDRPRAIGYAKAASGWTRDDYDALTLGPGGVYSSAEDMCRWGIALDAGKVLKPRTLNAAYTVQVSALARPTPMGLGYQVEDIGKGPLKGEYYAALFGIRDGFQGVDMRLKSHPFRYVQLSNSSRQLDAMEVPNIYFGTPQPPSAPALIRDVTFPSGGGRTLAGTLTLPSAGHAPFPVAISLTGSGPHFRDGNRGPDDHYVPFKHIAESLAARGVAMLRLDDRGVGRSTGDANATTGDDVEADTAAAIAWLRRDPSINGDRIALIGHSFGGIVAPIVAAHDPQVAAVVLMGAPATSFRETMRYQWTYTISQDATIAPGDRAAALAAAMRQQDQNVKASDQHWRQWAQDRDPLPTARQLTCPVLILQGTTDRAVPPEDARTLADAIRGAGNAHVTVRLFDDLNHHFQRDRVGATDRYGQLATQDLAPEFLDAIASWLARTLETPAR